jgi:hypothetical protein
MIEAGGPSTGRFSCPLHRVCASHRGVDMVSPPTTQRNTEGTQSEGRAQEGSQKVRPLPNLTPSPLNVVNVHCSVFKAYPWCEQPSA